MAGNFDPYFKWLGIPPEHQPPDHYRLLGLQRFEDDVEVIENAVDSKMSFLRSCRLGARVAIAERLLNELAEAKICLLNQDRKQAYDAQLRQQQPAKQAAIKTAEPLAGAVPVATALTPAAQETATEPRDDVQILPDRMSAKRPIRRSKRSPQTASLVILAVVTSAAVLLVAFMYATKPPANENVVNNESSGAIATTPTLPPDHAIASNDDHEQTPVADAGDENAESSTGTDPALVETNPQVDEQPKVDPEAGPLPLGNEPPADSVVSPSTPDVQTEPVKIGPNLSAPNQTDLTSTDSNPTDPNQDVPPESAETPAPKVSVDSPANESPANVQRKAIPSPADQAAIETTVREIYQVGSVETPAERKALIEKLLDDAVATRDAPNEQFVMLRMAGEMAAEEGEVSRASFTVGLIQERFQIDAVAMRLNLIEQAVKARSSPEDKLKSLTAALPLLEEALGANRFADVEKTSALVHNAAKRLRDKQLIDRAADLRKKAGTLARDYEKAKSAFAELKSNPEDPQANLAVGSFWCFAKGEWGKGLPYLSKSEDPALDEIATNELKSPTAAADRAELADAWHKASRNAKEYVNLAMLRRAAKWYQEAIPELTGLTATAAQKKLDEINESLAEEEKDDPAKPKTRLARIVAACDSGFELYINGEFLLRGGRSNRPFGGRFGGKFPFPGNNQNDGNNRESQEVQRELKAGDILIAKCTNFRSECGFACVIQFLDDKATIATSPGGAWKVFAPADPNQWFNPKGIAATDSAKPADGDKHVKIFEETSLRCLSIWGTNRNQAYLVLKLR